jgi:spore germination cell wall hydrolase CwlJ-like protein
MLAMFNFVMIFALMLFILPFAKVTHVVPTTYTEAPVAKQVEKAAPKVSDKELRCLAENVYHEARGEGHQGMMAVAKVTLNRVATVGFPDTICGVVHQASQFSWTLSPTTIRDRTAFEHALGIARTALHIEEDITNGALFFHTIQIKKPRWAHSLEESIVLNNHVFYKGR